MIFMGIKTFSFVKKLIDLYKCDFNDLYNAVLQTNDN